MLPEISTKNENKFQKTLALLDGLELNKNFTE
jgi:hypothetical protein